MATEPTTDVENRPAQTADEAIDYIDFERGPLVGKQWMAEVRRAVVEE